MSSRKRRADLQITPQPSATRSGKLYLTPTTQPAAPRTVAADAGDLKLLDLPDELVTAVLMGCDDCAALVHASRACKRLLQAARDDRIWRPILLAFFDLSLIHM